MSEYAPAFRQARAAFLTLALTGLRRSELQALRWRDVDLVEGEDERVFCHVERGSVYRAETFKEAFDAALRRPA